MHLTPATTDPELAARWFERFEGAGLDGVVAKAVDLAYVPDKRLMLKVKHDRTADCAVAGFRWHKDGEGVGSLLLGLYDDAGTLHHVGRGHVVHGRAAQGAGRRAGAAPDRRARGPPLAGVGRAPSPAGGQRLPGAGSRWNNTQDLSWEPLRVEWVAEVAYDNLQGDRFRHATQLVRWRPDRDPASCTYAQLERPVPEELANVFGA